MITLKEYLTELQANRARLIDGPKGKWISYTVNDIKHSMPVGKSISSQSAMLNDMNVLVTEDGQPIATANVYEVVDTLEI
jgi:S-methylmethionine-dependent homocysteine/selenocysteine methylase